MCTAKITTCTCLRKSDCLGCAVLLCLVACLTLLASFFLPSHLSLKHVYSKVMLHVTSGYNLSGIVSHFPMKIIHVCDASLPARADLHSCLFFQQMQQNSLEDESLKSQVYVE